MTTQEDDGTTPNSTNETNTNITNQTNINANTNNHAVIVSSSRYWFNYRHAVNALVFYQLAKSNGIPDENIVLMLADDLPSNTRNPHKNGMYNDGVVKSSDGSTSSEGATLYDASTEIDYRGEDVTVQSFVRVLLGRQVQPHQPVLHTNADSNILIYLTGHGGDQFFKFQDIEEITADEIAATLQELHDKRKYKQILLVADTCQAFTLGDAITAPNVMVIGSSLRGESSYAHHSDYELGLSVIERYTHAFLKFITTPINSSNTKSKKKDKKQEQSPLLPGNHTSFTTMSVKEAMVDPYPFYQQRANIGFRDELMERDVDTILMGEFFANHQLQQGRISDNDNEAKLLSWSASMTPITLPGGWPTTTHNVDTTPHQRIRTPVSSQRRRNILLSSAPHKQPTTLSRTALSLEEQEFVMDPSDGRFLGLVALLIGLVLALSRRN